MELMEAVFNFLFRKKLTLLVYFENGRCRSFSMRAGAKDVDKFAEVARKIIYSAYKDGTGAVIQIKHNHINISKSTAIEVRTGWFF